mgnify:CR=1 FL=1
MKTVRLQGAARLVLIAGLLAGSVSRPAAAMTIKQANQLLDDWQLERATAAAEKILAARPSYPPAQYLAGRVQHQRGRHLAAVSLLEAAEAGGVEGAAYMLPLATASARYSAHFQSLETDHFEIRYLDKDEIVAHYAAPVLEKAYAGIGQALEFFPAEQDQKIVVEIYPDAAGLAGATGLTVEEIETSGTIAVCKFHRLMITSPLATLSGYGWADTIAHEFVHLIISKKSRNNVPIWLHEGIAKYYESAWRGAPGQALSPYGEKLLADATRSGEFITYDEMHPSMAKLPSQKAATLAFAEVFTTMEFLTKRYGSEAIPELLTTLAEGISLEQGLQRTFEMNLSQLEKRWQKYLRRRNFRLVPGAAPQPIKLATNGQNNEEGPPIEAMREKKAKKFARLGELLQLRDHHAAAVVEYEKARDAAGLKYATLNYRLARAYKELGRTDAALEVLEKSLRAHPDDGDSHLLAGRILFQQEHIDAAYKHFKAVTLINPFNPEIHAALASYYDDHDRSDAAERERRFLKLSRKPRPSRDYGLPAPPAGSARVHIVPRRWGPVRLDGQPFVAAPRWSHPVEAGSHTIEYIGEDGSTQTHSFSVEANADKVLRLQ